MKARFLAILLAAGMILGSPVARAQEEGPPPEARLKGYGPAVNVQLEPTSTALTWFLMFGLAGACVAVMFKNAKRSHLD